MIARGEGARVLLALALLATSARAGADTPKPPPVLVAPKQLSAPVVPYPEGATGSAEIVLQLVVAADGTVESATVVEGDEPFAAAARTAATRDGVPVRATIRARISFQPPAAPTEQTPLPSAPAPSTPGKEDEPIELVVEGERKEVATTTLGGGEVKILPGAFGDPFRAIESLPGVTPLINGL